MKDLQFESVKSEQKSNRSTSVKRYTINNPLTGHYAGTVPGKFNDNYVIEVYGTEERVILQSVTDLADKMSQIEQTTLVQIYFDGYLDLGDGRSMIKVEVKKAVSQ